VRAPLDLLLDPDVLLYGEEGTLYGAGWRWFSHLVAVAMDHRLFGFL
jgi:hypothetical protein